MRSSKEVLRHHRWRRAGSARGTKWCLKNALSRSLSRRSPKCAQPRTLSMPYLSPCSTARARLLPDRPGNSCAGPSFYAPPCGRCCCCGGGGGTASCHTRARGSCASSSPQAVCAVRTVRARAHYLGVPKSLAYLILLLLAAVCALQRTRAGRLLGSRGLRGP